MRAMMKLLSGLLLVVVCPILHGEPPGEREPSIKVKKPTGVVLRIRSARDTYKMGEKVRVEAVLENHRAQPVTLVQPGDGSRCAWRTPLVGWSVKKVPDGTVQVKHPDKVVLYRGGRCGNVNPLKKKEVFTIQPAGKQKLNEWAGQPTFPRPGMYRVVFYYVNRPGIKWKGLPLGKHDVDAMQRVQKSFPCTLRSNELLVTVVPAR